MLRGSLVLFTLLTAVLTPPVYAIDPTQLPDDQRELLVPIQPQWPEVYFDLARSLLSPVRLGGGPIYPGSVPRPANPEPPGEAWGPVQLRTEGLALLGRLRTMLAEGQVTDETFSEWSTKHGVDKPTLVAALDEVKLWHPMDPVYLPICRALWDRLGDNLDEYLKFPYSARITMGIYLGVLEREDDAKELLSSVPEEWQKQDPTVPMYHVANELFCSRKRSPRLCIWAWKWGATMQGAADQAFVSCHIRQVCESLGDPKVVAAELIPWTEAALARSGSEDRWDYAVGALLWSYSYTGQMQRARQRGHYWLEMAKVRGVSFRKTMTATLQLAGICREVGAIEDARRLLETVCASDSSTLWHRQKAEAQLARLPGSDGESRKGLLSRPVLRSVSPDKIVVNCTPASVAQASVRLEGSPTLKVERAECTLESAVVASGDPLSAVSSGTIQSIKVTMKAPDTVGDLHGLLMVQTNDVERAALQIPLTVKVAHQLLIRPSRFFFGFTKPKDEKTVAVTVSSKAAFDIVEGRADKPELLEVRWQRRDSTMYLVRATLTLRHASGPDVVQGDIVLKTSLPGERVVKIPYEAHLITGD